MKLQKQLSRVVDGKEYAKWVIVIPPVTIETLGWNDGEQLKEEIQGIELIIRPMKEKEIKELILQKAKMTYDEFKTKIKSSLIKNPTGLTWTQIRDTTGLYQKVPNNKWVKKLEKDINLVRTRNKRGNIIWKLK